MRAKMHKQFYYCILLIVCISCSNQSTFDDIKIGMTYNEVENILGKPNNILRGVSKLVENLEGMSNELLYFLNTDSYDIQPRFTQWIAPRKIQNIGALLYVSWAYNDTKADTFFVIINNQKTIYDTTYSETIKYYLGDLEVSEKEYYKNNGRVYLSPQGRIITKSDYEFFLRMNTGGLPYPKDGTKKIKTVRIPHITSKFVDKGHTYNYYQVSSIKQVIFDASSGRVTTFGYFPISMKQIFIK